MILHLSSAGIAVCVGMASTFAYTNATFRHQVSLRVKQTHYITCCADTGFWTMTKSNIFQFYVKTTLNKDTEPFSNVCIKG